MNDKIQKFKCFCGGITNDKVLTILTVDYTYCTWQYNTQSST